jgi:hypothetical protein
MDITNRIKPEARRDTLAHDRQYFPRFRVLRVDKVEFAAFGADVIGHLALADAMRGGDDPALGSLTEDLAQTHDRYGNRRDDVGQHLPLSDRWRLISIANQLQCRSFRKGADDGSRFNVAWCVRRSPRRQVELSDGSSSNDRGS